MKRISGYAFPNDHSQSGMTKREYFAGLAMQALITGLSTARQHDIYSEEIAIAAIAYADALLEKLAE